MNFERSAGILLHPTSLPGKYGIGTIGENAHHFVDFLVECGQKLWQVFLLGPTGYGDSPYQSFSTFAGNPLLIDLEMLKEDSLLTQADLDTIPEFDFRYNYRKVDDNERTVKALLGFEGKRLTYQGVN